MLSLCNLYHRFLSNIKGLGDCNVHQEQNWIVGMGDLYRFFSTVVFFVVYIILWLFSHISVFLIVEFCLTYISLTIGTSYPLVRCLQRRIHETFLEKWYAFRDESSWIQVGIQDFYYFCNNRTILNCCRF